MAEGDRLKFIFMSEELLCRSRAITCNKNNIEFLMPQTLRATYRSGVFILQTDCNLPEETEVDLVVQLCQITPPKITDISARQNFLKLLVERMQRNPIPVNAPPLTRDMLYESR